MKLNEINIRDPFVLPYGGIYYMYGTRGADCWGECNGFDVYMSDNLRDWSEAIEVFHKPEGFWADRNYWAPEVHEYNGRFYAFVTFKSPTHVRGTQILVSDTPLGPFQIHSDGPVTPTDWECLDGTFYVDNKGVPYMVFCHEWLQVGDGKMCLIQLTPDLMGAASKPLVLFSASELQWTTCTMEDRISYVTDGPYLYQTKGLNGGKAPLLMLWSSHSKDGYAEAIAISEAGNIEGPWKHAEELLYTKDGGHGMIFQTFEGKLLLALHTPNHTLEERPIFLPLEEREQMIYVL
ncbi:MAG: glycoside hydrolase family 43 protein [Anaerocolumna sp.]